MNNHSHHVIMSREAGMDALMKRCDFERRVETVPLAQAFGRIAAVNLYAQHALPNAPTSAMDAIAVRFDDFAGGMPDTRHWKRGTDYEFCNTGIGMPEGFDTAIRIEDIEFDKRGLGLHLAHAPAARGELVNAPGSSMREGELLVEAGSGLSPAHVALAAQGGYTELDVIAKPRVAFIPSGNELVAHGAELGRGKSVECNSLLFCGKTASWGAEPIVNEICPDDWETIKAALVKHLSDADIVVINAGSSKGTDDLTVEILEQMGEVIVHEFDHGPGKHSSLSVVDGKPVVGIAGPPMGAEFCLDWYVKPLIDAYLGKPAMLEHTMWATLTQDIEMQPRPVNVVQRVKLERDDMGYLLATPLPNASPVLKMCAQADAFLVIDKDSYGFAAGEDVVVELKYPYTLPA